LGDALAALHGPLLVVEAEARLVPGGDARLPEGVVEALVAVAPARVAALRVERLAVAIEEVAGIWPVADGERHERQVVPLAVGEDLQLLLVLRDVDGVGGRGLRVHERGKRGQADGEAGGPGHFLIILKTLGWRPATFRLVRC